MDALQATVTFGSNNYSKTEVLILLISIIPQTFIFILRKDRCNLAEQINNHFSTQTNFFKRIPKKVQLKSYETDLLKKIKLQVRRLQSDPPTCTHVTL